MTIQTDQVAAELARHPQAPLWRQTIAQRAVQQQNEALGYVDDGNEYDPLTALVVGALADGEEER